MKKKLFSLMMMCLFAIGGFAQGLVEIGSYENYNFYLPHNGYYDYSISQQIYTAEELADVQGSIYRIGFNNLNYTNTRSFDVYLTHTDVDSFDDVEDWIEVDSADLVFSGDLTMTSGEWSYFELETPFVYDGTSNLLLVVYDKTGDWTSSYGAYPVFATDENQALYFSGDDFAYDPTNVDIDEWMNEASFYNALSVKNNIRLVAYDDTQVTNNLPTNSYYKFGITQQIYTAADIDSVGCDISGIGFFNIGDAQTRNIDVYMVPVDTNAMSTWALATMDSADIAAARVFSGEVNFAAGDWTNIPIRRFCDYDGSFNIAVIVDDNTDEGIAGLNFLAMEDVVANSAMHYYDDDSSRFNPDPFDLTGVTGVADSVRPKVVWDFAPKGLVQIGDMTGGFSALPLSATQNYSFSQQIYTPQEIGMSGTIVSIAYCGRPSLMDGLTRNISIYMTETDLEQYAASSDTMIACSASDLVFQGNVSFIAGDWKTIQLTRRFDYDYEKNLLVTVIDNTASAVSSYQYFYYHAAPQMAMYNYNTTTPFDITSTNTVGYVSSSYYRSTIQLQFWYDGIDPELDPDIYFLENGSSITPITRLEMGYRPNGAWMRPAMWWLHNKTGNDVTVRDHDFTPNPDFFTLLDQQTPFSMANNDSVPMFFATADSTEAGLIQRQFVLFYDQVRAAGIWNIAVTMYDPIENDVFELATELDMDDLPYVDTLHVWLNDTTRWLYDNYVLAPDTVPDGNDAVYKLTFDNDVLFNAYAYGENAKLALYTEDFYESEYGIPGPDYYNTYEGPIVGVNPAGSDPFDAVVGDPETTWVGYASPMNCYYNYSYSQILYRSAELAVAGVESSEMSQLGFYVYDGGDVEQTNIKIWMANVTEDTVTATTVSTANMTLVFEGSMTPTAGWNFFDIEAAGFAWDGVSNLLVTVQRNTGSYISTYPRWFVTESGFTSVCYGYSDSAGPYNLDANTYTGYTTAYRPNTRFVSGTPNNRANVANVANAPRRNRDEATLMVNEEAAANNGYIPFYGLYSDEQGTTSECIIPAEDLADMEGGEISQMTFYLSTSATAAWNATWQVYLAEVDETTLSDVNGPSAGTVVFEGTLDATGADLTIEFDEPYTYNGGNLLIGSYVLTAGTYISAYFAGVSTSGATAYYDCGASTGHGSLSFLPKVLFTYTPASDEPEPEPEPYVVNTVMDFSDGMIPADWTGECDYDEWYVDTVATGGQAAFNGMSLFMDGQANGEALYYATYNFEGQGTMRFNYIAKGGSTLDVVYGESTANLHTLASGLNSNTWKEFEVDLSELGETRGQYIIGFRSNGATGGVVGLDNIFINLYGNPDAAIEDLTVVAGTYYLVVSSTEDSTFMVNICPRELPCPIAASNPTPNDDADGLEPRRVDLYWELGEYTTEYRLVFGTTYYCEETLIDWTSDLAQNYTVRGLYNNTNYFWRIDERNGNCETIGEVWGFTTHFNVPGNLRLEDPSIFVGEPAVVLWDNIADRTFRKYNIYVDGTYVGSTPTTYIPDQYLTYTIDSLGYNMNPGYAIQVSAVYDEGESALSDPLMVKVSGNGTIAGHVYEQDGTTGIAGATVTFEGFNEFNEFEEYTATTNANGAYSITAHATSIDTANASVSYLGYAEKEGYQGPVEPIQGNPRAVVYNATTQANFQMDEIFYPLGEVIAEYYPDITSDDEYVKVYWSMGIMSEIVEDFETGDFSQFAWEVGTTYPWQITTTSPYEGLYCVKSGNAGVASSTSTLQVTVNIPRDGEMSFFVKPSCETNWDMGYFYIDGVQRTSFTGAGSWTEKVYTISAGDHTFKWEYTKDSSVNSNDDCIYLDYVTFFRATEPVPAGTAFDFEDGTMQGWTSLDADGDGYGWYMASEIMTGQTGHNGSADFVFSQSYDNNVGVLYPDNYLVSPQTTLGGQLIFYACAQDASYAAEHFGVAVSTTNGTSASAFTTIQEWTMTAKSFGMPTNYSRGNKSRVQGNWYQYTVDLSAYAGQTGYVAIRHFNCSDMFYLNVDDIIIAQPSKAALNGAEAYVRPAMPQMAAGDRSFHHYRIYRTNCYNDGPYNSDNTVLLASDWPTDTVYIDTNFDTVSPGVYKWGVSRVYQGNRTDVYPDPNGRESEIVWSNCLDKDMYLEEGDVTVNVLLNSADSPEGTVVTFVNQNEIEQELYPIDPVTLDITGFYAYETFRKGEYTITVEKDGYVTETHDVSIWDATDLRYVLTEIIYNTHNLYVSRTGWAMWEPGGAASGGGGGGGGAGAGELTVNDGTTVNSYVPVYGFYCDAYLKCEYIIPAADLAAMNNSNINSMTYYLNSPAAESWGSANFKVFMKEVSNTTLTAYTGYADATVVYEGALDGTQATMTVNFTTPYHYNGGNLLVGVYNTQLGSYESSSFSGVEATGACVQGYSYSSLDAVSTNTRDFLPKTTFTYGGREDRHLEAYKVLCESIDHEPIFNENTVYPFCQVATDQLVEGEHYLLGVAAIYSTGMSDYEWVEWEYEPCDHYADLDLVEAGVTAEGNYLSWDGGTPGPIPGAGDEFTVDFESGMPAGWTTIDANNDGYDWVLGTEIGGVYLVPGASLAGTGHNGSNDMICSGSYDNNTYQAITPDNYLVSPLVNITNGSTFSFWACAQDAGYAAEHFGVGVSTDGINFTMVQEWTMTSKEGMKANRGMNAQGNWYQKTVDLSSYAGQQVYIAIRHFNCSDQFVLDIDDITLTVGAKGGRAMWDYVASFTGTSAGQQAVATDGNYIYTASWQTTPTGGYTFYQYTLDGTFVEGFNIPGATGIRDLTTDGTYFYGTSGGAQIFKLDLANRTLVGTINCSGLTSRHISYDPVRNGLWSGNWSTLALYDMNGSLIQSAAAPESAYSSVYFVDDNNVEHLYLFCQPNSDAKVYDYNIATNTISSSPVFDFAVTPGFNGIAGGSFAANYNNQLCWFGNCQQDPNLIGIYELGASTTPTPPPTPLEGVLGYMIFRDGEWVAELPATATGFIDEEVYGEHEYLVRVIYDGTDDLPSNNYWYAMSCGYEVTGGGEQICEPGDPISGAYYYMDGEDFGAVISWGEQVEPISEWLYYDDGIAVNSVGTGGSDVYWGIMIPASMLAAYDGTYLTEVALYEDAEQNTQPITLNIFYGGTTAPATLVHTQNVTPEAADDFHVIDLTAALPIDVTQNLWITFLEYGAYPAVGCNGTGNPNGGWISLDGIDWDDVASYGLNYTWMIRGFVTNEAKSAVSELNAIEFVGGGNGNAADLSNHFGEDFDKVTNQSFMTQTREGDIIAYNIYRSTDGILYDLIATVPAEAGVTYYEYYDQAAAGTYYYQVTAVYEDGCESYPAASADDPDEDYVIVIVTGIEDNMGKVALYPNPTNGLVKIEARDMNHITVVSVLGQVVYDSNVSGDEFELNMAQWNAGVYVVRIATENGVSTQRVTVVK